MVTYDIEGLALDVARRELRDLDRVIPIEPQAFDILRILIEQRSRLVSKGELIDQVWGGRAVSDAAVSSQIKAVRRAIGDDGRAQRLIRTLHGRGFRFVGAVRVIEHGSEESSKGERSKENAEERTVAAATPASVEIVADADVIGTLRALPAPAEPTAPAGLDPYQPMPPGGGRPSIAVLPFQAVGEDLRCASLADALPHDLIAELSRLRWLFVIARQSSFRFRGAQDVREVGRRLGARYCLSGAVEVEPDGVCVYSELIDAVEGGVVWAERWRAPLDGVHERRAATTAKIAAALELRINDHEVERIRLSAPDRLDAWSCYHLGLNHMFRFAPADNARALSLFEKAVSLDPNFARAHAGLSFAQYQLAFLRHVDDVEGQTLAARRSAERAFELDPLDPAANLVLGRAIYLQGDLDGGLAWIDQATALCPSYAHAISARGWIDALSGRAEESRRHIDLALALSPLDPMRYSMFASQALAELSAGRYDVAIERAERAARTPRSNELTRLVAAAACAIGGHGEAARRWIGEAWRLNPTLTLEEFLRAFPFRNQSLLSDVSIALRRVGLPMIGPGAFSPSGAVWRFGVRGSANV